MLNQLAIAEVGNAMLGNIIVVSGSFLILLALLKHFAWGPISDILKKREDKIANDLDSAEQSRINSAKMEQEREQQLLASRSDAADITVERDSALNSVKDDVAELSLQIAEKILNKELSPEMHESLINQYIEGLGSSNETR